jgi:hypothetical protein
MWWVKELYKSRIECSKMRGGEKCSWWGVKWSPICSEWQITLFKGLTKKYVKNSASQFQSCLVNFHKFCRLFLRILSHHSYIRLYLKSWCKEWLWLFRVIPQRWRWIYQSQCTSNSWLNLGFICQCRTKEHSRQWCTYIEQTSQKKFKKRSAY